MPRTLSALVVAASLAPAAVAQTQIVFSNFDTPVYEDGRSMGGPNLLLAIKTQAPATLVATRVEVFTGEQPGTNTLALWSHDAANNAPLVSLGDGSWEMGRHDGWQGALLNTPVVLTQGQDFWIVWAPVNGAQASSEGLGTAATGAQPYRSSFNGGATWSGPFSSVLWKFRLWSGTPGHYEVFGSGCQGSVGTTSLGFDGAPLAGSSFDLHLDNAPASALAALAFGDSDAVFQGLALPYSLAPHGAAGCAVLASSLVTLFTLADAAGHAVVPVGMPNDPSIAGFHFYDQWFCLDAAANSLGITASNGGRAIAGA